jgi:L-alanine-DL-glutamate epimerase-like enolase superfamily enzyme
MASGIGLSPAIDPDGRRDFKSVFEEGVVQPDLPHAGGITECRKITAMAEAYDVAVALLLARR